MIMDGQNKETGYSCQWENKKETRQRLWKIVSATIFLKEGVILIFTIFSQFYQMSPRRLLDKFLKRRRYVWSFEMEISLLPLETTLSDNATITTNNEMNQRSWNPTKTCKFSLHCRVFIFNVKCGSTRLQMHQNVFSRRRIDNPA